MTSLLPLEAVGALRTAAAPAARAPLGADGVGFDAALARLARTPTLGEAFETQTLASFLGALLPAETSTMWGGKAGALWRGVYAEKIAAEVAAGGGVGIAATIDRTLPMTEDRK